MSQAPFSLLTWQGSQENTSVFQSDRSRNVHFSGTFLALSECFTVSDNQPDTLREIPSYKKNQGGNYTESVQLIILIITNIHKHDEGQPCFVTVHHHPMFSSDLEQVCLAARVAQFPLPQFSPSTPPQVPLKKDTYESHVTNFSLIDFKVLDEMTLHH